ncbi:uncharacterized protein LOC142358538 [Convolutriloba macropyga]|uniref:uncharacterized protein LOC142358538 n=1 Tax=Convolutriloba macropyga TaxID=536237 RepID=UPI003F51FC01
MISFASAQHILHIWWIISTQHDSQVPGAVFEPSKYERRVLSRFGLNESVLVEASILARDNCREQFGGSGNDGGTGRKRWNCPTEAVFGDNSAQRNGRKTATKPQSREAAFIEAIQVASVVSKVHLRCLNGEMEGCDCYAPEYPLGTPSQLSEPDSDVTQYHPRNTETDNVQQTVDKPTSSIEPRTQIGSPEDAVHGEPEVFPMSRIPPGFGSDVSVDDCRDGGRVAEKFAKLIFEKPLRRMSTLDLMSKAITLHNFNAAIIASRPTKDGKQNEGGNEKENSGKQCMCTGPSGSCVTSVCWTPINPLPLTVKQLTHLYNTAREVISTPIDFLPPPEFVPQLLSADVSKRLKPRHLVYAETVQLAESPSERKKCLSSHSVCVNKVNQKTRRLRAKRDTDKEKEYQGSKGCLKHCCSGHFYQDSESGNFRCQ